jgi:hypothetical protein
VKTSNHIFYYSTNTITIRVTAITILVRNTVYMERIKNLDSV